MEFAKITTVIDLPLGRFDGSIRARVLWSWRGRSLDTKELSSLNFVLMDEGNARIQATVKLDDYEQFADVVTAGHIYVFKNFTVANYSESKYHRAFRPDKRVFFSNYTSVAVINNNPTCIPAMGFDIYSLDEVETLSSQSVFLIDVIGVVDKVFPTHYVKNTFTDLQQSYVTFLISDGSYSIKVKFWDQLGQQFLDDMKKQVQQPVVIVIACAKAQTWSGDIYVSNNPPTRYYLNLDHYIVEAFRKTIVQATQEDDVIGKTTINTERIFKLHELKKLGPEFIERIVTVELTITGFKEKCEWYKRLCSPCQAEVQLVKDVFKCPTCRQTIPFPNRRFCVHTLATDNTDTVSVIFDDAEVRNIIGLSFLDLQLLETIEDTVIPKAFKKLLNKRLLVTLQLTKNNLMDNCNIFSCMAAEEVADVGESTECENNNIGSPPKQMGAVTCSEEFGGFSPNTRTPTTEQSTNTSRVRKQNQAVPYDIDEHTPLQKLKAPKKERLYRFAGDENIRLLSLAKISQLNIDNIQPQIPIKCLATIIKIHTDEPWLFTECTYCTAEMVRSTCFTCVTCGLQNEEMVVRFKVVAHIQDESYSIQVVLPHKLIMRLLRVYVPNFFPQIKVTQESVEALLAMEGKKLLFVLSITEENLTGGSSRWQCVDVEEIRN